MRTIKYIAVHCTAGLPNQSIESIKAYWQNVLKWKNPGYHYIISEDGKVTQLHPENELSNGVKGYNSSTINVCYIGGLIIKNGKYIYTDTRTNDQKKALLCLLKELKIKYPDAIIQGHRDFSPDINGNGKIDQFEWIKVCPCFDAKEEYKNI